MHARYELHLKAPLGLVCLFGLGLLWRPLNSAWAISSGSATIRAEDVTGTLMLAQQESAAERQWLLLHRR